MSADISPFDHYFYNMTANCPYGKPHWAVYRQTAVNRIDSRIFEALIHAGCRRAGKVIYRMVCPDCEECVPIRMKADKVRLGKTQRKIKNKNQDLNVVIRKPEFSEEKLSLYARFLKYRYPAQRNPERFDYEEFFVHSCADTLEFCYYLEEKIAGLAIVDVTKNLMNGVYFFFDPDLEKRSPGVFNFIHLTEYCREKGIPYFATGYYIKDLPAMAYKARFYPHELLVNKEWKEVEKPGK